MVEKLTQIKGLYLKVYVKFSGIMQVYLQKSGQNSTLSTILIFEFRLRVRKGGPWFRVWVVLISRPLYVGSLGVLCLTHIIGVYYGEWAWELWGSGVWGLGCGRDEGSGSGSLFTHPLQSMESGRPSKLDLQMFDFQSQYFCQA